MNLVTLWKPCLALAAALVVASPGLAADKADSSHPDPPLLTVTGTGEVHADPDEATTRFGITRQADTAADVQQQVNTVAQAILAAVGRAGVPKEQVQTAQLTLQPIYAPQKPDSVEPPRIVAYRASNIISVRLTQLTQVGPVIDAGLGAGANQLEGVYFALKNDAAARSHALREAVREAKEKATAIADALGVRLVTVHAVEEGSVNVRQPVFAGVMRARAADASATPVSAGQITIDATVTIRWRIQERQ